MPVTRCFIVVDYPITQPTDPKTPRDSKSPNLSRLKALAKELDVPSCIKSTQRSAKKESHTKTLDLRESAQSSKTLTLYSC